MGWQTGVSTRQIAGSERDDPKLKLMWRMNRLRKMYRDQEDIEKIAQMYRDVR